MSDLERVSSRPRASFAPGSLFAGRYELGESAGQGGMADVVSAYDRVRGFQVALKRLRGRPDGLEREHSKLLFEREYHVLSELSHPRVVTAYDYGVADGCPYYAMELLDGGDLHLLSPLPVERVCSIFRDVCSVLSLLHSRRLVYRDLNARNIRCTSSGVAKLIDFGAMMPMGTARKIIGTPGFVAPEIVHQQPVDGRADLYALGCAMYYALLGRAPYAARDFTQLRLLWATPAVPPSLLGLEIPAALEELIMGLLQQDPALRPGTAAEVMDHLSAVGALPEDDALSISGAYLATPPMIGRASVLSRIQGHIDKSQSGNGRTVLLDAEAGAGRSRVLDACVLEAKRRGLVTARTDAADAQRGDYACATSLIGQLIEAIPSALVRAESLAATLGHVLPPVRRAYPEIELAAFADPRDRRPRIQAALRAFILALSGERELVIAVDDVQRIDEPSLALLALLSAELETEAVCLLLAAERGAASSSDIAMDVLAKRARVVAFGNLNHEETTSLLMAMFGESSQLSLLADRIFRNSSGNPRDILQLSQYLLSQDVIRFQHGRFLLPSSLDAHALPSTATEASAQIVASMSQTAQRLARAMALSGDQGLSFEDCLALFPDVVPGGILRALSELATAEVFRVAGGIYGLSRPMWGQALLVNCPAEERAHLHESLARMVETRGYSPLRHVRHLRHAGQAGAALDTMVAFCTASTERTDNDMAAFHDFVDSLPADWYELFDWAVRTARSLGRPALERYVILQRISGILGLDARAEPTHLCALIEQLRHDSGLQVLASISDEVPEGERLKLAFETAQATFDTAPAEVRVLSPFVALKPLARAEIVAAAIVVHRFDYELLHGLPDLRPLEVLSPALTVVRLLTEGLAHRMAARTELSREAYGELLRRIEQPDRSGLDSTHANYTRFGVFNGLGMIDAAMGLSSALDYAEALQESQLLRVNSGLIRMLHHYFHGDHQKGDALKRELVLLRIEATAKHYFGDAHLLPEVVAHSSAQDLPRLSELIGELETKVEGQPGWVPILEYGRAEYHRMRGDLSRALEILTELLVRHAAGTHQIWPNAAGAHVDTLVSMHRYGEAVALGDQYLAQARDAQLGFGSLHVRAALSVARAHVGTLPEARAEIDGLLASTIERGVTGLLLGRVHEASALVALLEGDSERALKEIGECAHHLRAADSRIGHARCDRLRRAMNSGGTGVEQSGSAGINLREEEWRSQLASAFDRHHSQTEMAEEALRFLLQEAGAREGALFAPGQGGAFGLRAAQPVDLDVDTLYPLALQHWESLSAHSRSDDLYTQTAMGVTMADDGGGGPFRPILICHFEQGGLQVTAVAMVKGERTVSTAVCEALSREILGHFGRA